MQQDIIFKKIDNRITIIVNENLSFQSFIETLKKRLEHLYIKDNLLKTNVTLDIHNIPLSSKEILQLFDVFQISENIFINKIIYKENVKKNIILHEGNIRAGEIKFFSSNTLLMGNINISSKVIVNGNLYVIGKVNGSVEIKGKDNKLVASSISNSTVKIGNIEKHIENEIINSVLKKDNEMIIDEKFIDRRESIYGKGNCSYIW